MNQDNEEKWKDIEDFEGLYAVSDRGRVMNLKTDRILKPGVNGAGYEVVCLCKDGKKKQYYNHRLTADAFIPNPDNLPEVNHIDECKTNNNVYNLEWVTASQNNRHSMYKRSCRINQYNLDGEIIRQWNSSCEIERELGFWHCVIIQCCKGKGKTAYGYRWEYADGLHQRKINRPIVVTTTEDGFIAQFKSATEASRCLGITPHCIRYVLKGKYKTTHGLKFKYLDEL